MALKRSDEKKHQKITFKTGYFYKFKYQGYRNDPEPIIIFINAISGINPKTGNQHRYIQAINLNYIPRKDRKKFVNDWIEYYNKTQNVRFTWKLIQRRYKYIKFGIRRYFYIPNYYIHKVRYIPFEDVQKEVVKSLFKDFSNVIKRKIYSKLKGKKK